MATRFAINPYREAGPLAAPMPEGVRAFHRSLPGYAPTPLIRRPALARSLGVGDLYVKYEGTRFGLKAFKGLGGSWALHRLLALRPGSFDTVSTASEGNHGRAVAWAARLMNVPCVIFLPAHAAPERIDNIRGEGAIVVLVDGSYEDAVQECDRVSRDRGWQIISDVGYEGYLEIPPLVVEGYRTLYQEVDEQLTQNGWPAPDLVLIPGGVGGILHAGVDHYRGAAAGPRVVGVEPAEGACLLESLLAPEGRPVEATGSRQTTMACLNCGEVSLPSWPVIRRGVDAILAIDDADAEAGVRLLYRADPGDEPIEAGNSGAATTGGLAALMRDPGCRGLKDHLALGPASIVLALCTEGAIDQAEFARCLAS